MSETWTWPSMEGLPVVDVNGQRLGRVERTDEATQEFRVRLAPRAARRLGEPALILRYEDVVDADDHEVTLREEAAFLAHPDMRPHEPLHR